MDLKLQIKRALEDNYHIGFSIEQMGHSGITTYIVRPSESNSNLFMMELQVKGDTRVTIECEPEQYGAEFVEIISTSNEKQRKNFISYWEKINEIGKTSIRIDDIPCSPSEFKEKMPPWNKFDLRFTKPAYYDIETEEKNEVITKFMIIICGMMLSLLDYEIEGYKEGSEIVVQSKKYERNPLNRMLCLYEKGYKCSVCGFDFEKTYGVIGKDFIHVHHSIMVSEMGENHIVNPSKELFPVCPNCHAMLHKKTPPYTIEELKKIVNSRK